MIVSFEQMLEKAKQGEPMVLAGAAAQDVDTIKAMAAAEEAGMIRPVLVGDIPTIERVMKEEGVTFASHIDGHRIFMGPEESMQIQSNLGSDIAMAFDECVENPARYEYAKASVERTLRWLQRCKVEHDRLNSLPDTVNPHQMLFGINQGCTFEDLRVEHMKQIAECDLDGYAIGGLAVGETTQEMYDIIEAVEEHLSLIHI